MARRKKAKGKSGKDKARTSIVGPTPELMARVTFKLEAVTEGGVVVGQAYRREPWFETLAKRSEEITDGQLRALRFYRNAHESAARSHTRCALDQTPRGIGDGGLPLPMWNGWNLEACERGVGAVLPTLRAVALEDLRYADVAMQRFGSRDRDYIIDGVTVNKPAPRSGRHPAIIQQEFFAALHVLEANVVPMISTRPVAVAA